MPKHAVRVSGVALSVLALVVSAAPAQTPRVVRGRVVAAEGGQPLRLARIVLAASGRPLDPVLTDGDGRFNLTVPDDRSLTLAATKAGYAYASAELSPAQARRPLLLRMRRSGAISGRVTGPNGTPMVQAIVTARSVDEPPAATGPSSFATSTDDLGNYRLGGLPAGRYAVAAASSPLGLPAANVTVSFWSGPRAVTSASSQDWSAGLREAMVGMTMPGVSSPASGAERLVTVEPGAEATAIDITGEPVRLVTDVLVRSGNGAVLTLGPRPLDQDREAAGPPARIRGRVTGPAGEPIALADVRLYSDTMGPLIAGAPPPIPMRDEKTGRTFSIRSTRSDDEGRFAFNGLTAGGYRIEALRVGYLSREQGARGAERHATIARGEETVDGIDLVLPRGGAVSGSIVDEQGEPILGALVQALQVRDVSGRMTAVRAAERRTDDRGRYRLFGLASGPYVISVTVDPAAQPAARGGRNFIPLYYPSTPDIGVAMPIAVDAGTEVSGMDITVRAVRAGRVTGQALDASGKPLDGSIRLLVAQRSGAVALEPRVASMGTDGRFELSGVPPGDYAVHAIGNRAPGRAPEFGYQHVLVGETDPPPLTIVTSTGATLEGVIVVDGQPQARASTVGLRGIPLDADRSWSSMGSLATLAITSRGEFYLSGVIGPTRLALSSSAEGWYLRPVLIAGVDVTTSGYDFGTAGRTFADLRIEVARGRGIITGRVDAGLSAQGRGSTVVVFATDRQRWFAGSSFVRLAAATADGSFQVERLPPGDYFVGAIDRVDDVTAEWHDAELLDTLSSAAQLVTLADGESRTIAVRR